MCPNFRAAINARLAPAVRGSVRVHTFAPRRAPIGTAGIAPEHISGDLLRSFADHSTRSASHGWPRDRLRCFRSRRIEHVSLDSARKCVFENVSMLPAGNVDSHCTGKTHQFLRSRVGYDDHGQLAVPASHDAVMLQNKGALFAS